MQYCTFCGQKYRDGDASCGHCGTPVPRPETVVSSIAAQTCGETPAAKRKSRLFSGIGTGALMVAIIALGVSIGWPPGNPANAGNSFSLSPAAVPGTIVPPTVSPLAIAPPVSDPAPQAAATTNQPAEAISRSYSWQFKGRPWTWELQVPQALYDYFKNLPRPQTADYSVYATHPFDDAYIESIAARIAGTGKAEGFTAAETLDFAIAFVQSLPYVAENQSVAEYARYPVETLVDNGGDCEDTAILMAALVKAMGYGTAILNFDAAAPGSTGHTAVGVAGVLASGTYWEHNGQKYYYLETTGENWGIGEIPDEQRSATARVYELKTAPLLTHEWASTGRPGFVDLKIEITNVGSAAAEGVYVNAGFDAGGDRLWNPQQSAAFTAGIDQTVTVTITLPVPQDKHTRIAVQIVYGGYAVANSFSTWFDT